MQNKNAIEAKSFDFAVRIVKLYQYITNEKKEFVLSKQLLRSGTSVGANVAEAERAQSQADFYAKMSIALKEANETDYWLRLLYQTDYLNENEYNSVSKNINEIIALLVSITKTVKATLQTERKKNNGKISAFQNHLERNEKRTTEKIPHSAFRIPHLVTNGGKL